MIMFSSVSIKVKPRLTLRAGAFYGKLLFCNLSFLCQSYAHLYAMHKSIPFMIPAERTDRVDNPVHFSQGHSVQQTIQLSEIRFDLSIVYAVHILVSLIQQRKEGFAIPQIQLVGCHIGFKCLDIFCHVHTKISSSRIISSALARMLFIRCTHVIGSLDFKASVIPSVAFI